MGRKRGTTKAEEEKIPAVRKARKSRAKTENVPAPAPDSDIPSTSSGIPPQLQDLSFKKKVKVVKEKKESTVFPAQLFIKCVRLRSKLGYNDTLAHYRHFKNLFNTDGNSFQHEVVRLLAKQQRNCSNGNVFQFMKKDLDELGLPVMLVYENDSRLRILIMLYQHCLDELEKNMIGKEKAHFDFDLALPWLSYKRKGSIIYTWLDSKLCITEFVIENERIQKYANQRAAGFDKVREMPPSMLPAIVSFPYVLLPSFDRMAFPEWDEWEKNLAPIDETVQCKKCEELIGHFLFFQKFIGEEKNKNLCFSCFPFSRTIISRMAELLEPIKDRGPTKKRKDDLSTVENTDSETKTAKKRRRNKKSQSNIVLSSDDNSKKNEKKTIEEEHEDVRQFEREIKRSRAMRAKRAQNMMKPEIKHDTVSYITLSSDDEDSKQDDTGNNQTIGGEKVSVDSPQALRPASLSLSSTQSERSTPQESGRPSINVDHVQDKSAEKTELVYNHKEIAYVPDYSNDDYLNYLEQRDSSTKTQGSPPNSKEGVKDESVIQIEKSNEEFREDDDKSILSKDEHFEIEDEKQVNIPEQKKSSIEEDITETNEPAEETDQSFGENNDGDSVGKNETNIGQIVHESTTNELQTQDSEENKEDEVIEGELPSSYNVNSPRSFSLTDFQEPTVASPEKKDVDDFASQSVVSNSCDGYHFQKNEKCGDSEQQNPSDSSDYQKKRDLPGQVTSGNVFEDDKQNQLSCENLDGKSSDDEDVEDNEEGETPMNVNSSEEVPNVPETFNESTERETNCIDTIQPESKTASHDFDGDKQSHQSTDESDNNNPDGEMSESDEELDDDETGGTAEQSQRNFENFDSEKTADDEDNKPGGSGMNEESSEKVTGVPENLVCSGWDGIDTDDSEDTKSGDPEQQRLPDSVDCQQKRDVASGSFSGDEKQNPEPKIASHNFVGDKHSHHGSDESDDDNRDGETAESDEKPDDDATEKSCQEGTSGTENFASNSWDSINGDNSEGTKCDDPEQLHLPSTLHPIDNIDHSVNRNVSEDVAQGFEEETGTKVNNSQKEASVPENLVESTEHEKSSIGDVQSELNDEPTAEEVDEACPDKRNSDEEFEDGDNKEGGSRRKNADREEEMTDDPKNIEKKEDFNEGNSQEAVDVPVNLKASAEDFIDGQEGRTASDNGESSDGTTSESDDEPDDNAMSGTTMDGDNSQRTGNMLENLTELNEPERRFIDEPELSDGLTAERIESHDFDEKQSPHSSEKSDDDHTDGETSESDEEPDNDEDDDDTDGGSRRKQRKIDSEEEPSDDEEGDGEEGRTGSESCDGMSSNDEKEKDEDKEVNEVIDKNNDKEDGKEREEIFSNRAIDEEENEEVTALREKDPVSEQTFDGMNTEEVDSSSLHGLQSSHPDSSPLVDSPTQVLRQRAGSTELPEEIVAAVAVDERPPGSPVFDEPLQMLNDNIEVVNERNDGGDSTTDTVDPEKDPKYDEAFVDLFGNFSDEELEGDVGATSDDVVDVPVAESQEGKNALLRNCDEGEPLGNRDICHKKVDGDNSPQSPTGNEPVFKKPKMMALKRKAPTQPMRPEEIKKKTSKEEPWQDPELAKLEDMFPPLPMQPRDTGRGNYIWFENMDSFECPESHQSAQLLPPATNSLTPSLGTPPLVPQNVIPTIFTTPPNDMTTPPMFSPQFGANPGTNQNFGTSLPHNVPHSTTPQTNPGPQTMFPFETNVGVGNNFSSGMKSEQKQIWKNQLQSSRYQQQQQFVQQPHRLPEYQQSRGHHDQIQQRPQQPHQHRPQNVPMTHHQQQQMHQQPQYQNRHELQNQNQYHQHQLQQQRQQHYQQNHPNPQNPQQPVLYGTYEPNSMISQNPVYNGMAFPQTDIRSRQQFPPQQPHSLNPAAYQQRHGRHPEQNYGQRVTQHNQNPAYTIDITPLNNQHLATAPPSNFQDPNFKRPHAPN